MPDLPSDDVVLELGERLARLCTAHAGGQLADIVAEADAEDLFGDLIGHVLAGDLEPQHLLALLNHFDDMLAVEGLHGLTQPNRQWQALPGLTPQRTESAWICPLRRCVRAETTATPLPCALAGTAMSRVSLAP
jgi:hypothetical protein